MIAYETALYERLPLIMVLFINLSPGWQRKSCALLLCNRSRPRYVGWNRVTWFWVRQARCRDDTHGCSGLRRLDTSCDVNRGGWSVVRRIYRRSLVKLSRWYRLTPYQLFIILASLLLSLDISVCLSDFKIRLSPFQAKWLYYSMVLNYIYIYIYIYIYTYIYIYNLSKLSVSPICIFLLLS